MGRPLLCSKGTDERLMVIDFINQIPVEILSEIFLLSAHTPDESECGKLARKGIPLERYRPPFARNAAPYTLSSVCTRWRSIGLSTPKLWSKFTIRDRISGSKLSDLDPETEKCFVAALRKWLKRSKDYPLQFSYLVPYPEPRKDTMTVLYEHTHRWSIVYFEYVLSFLSAPAFQQRLRRELLKAEKLDTLEFRNCGILSDIPFLRLPSLRRLAIDSKSLTVENPGCLNVTHLALTRLNKGMDTFFEYLQQFPSLISLEVSLRDTFYLARNTPTITPITHIALTELVIEGYSFHSPLRGILANIHLPNIRRLRLTEIDYYRTDEDVHSELYDDTNSFISRHESTFTDLEISGRSLSSYGFIDMLRMFPKYLVSCRFNIVGLTDEIVKKLTVHPSDSSQDLAPNLSYLYLCVPRDYYYYTNGGREKSRSGRLLTEMILSRWSRNPHITFVLEMLYTGTNPLSDPRIAAQMQRGSRLLVQEPLTVTF